MPKLTLRRSARTMVALTAGTIALALTGCGTSAPAGGDGGSATEGTVEWWGWVPEKGVAPAYIEAFNEEYPDIKVNYKLLTIDGYQAAIRPALASSAGPDVFDVASGAMFEQFKDFGVDLGPAAEEELGADWQSQVSPIGVSSFTDDNDELKALSVGLGFAGPVWINQDIFDEYGLTAPTDFTEWKEVCAVLEKNGVGCFIQGAQQVAFNQDTLQAIADTINPGLFTKATRGEAKWTDPDLVEALTAWKSMFDDGIMQEGALGQQQYPDANNGFLSGKYAMVQMGYWYSQYTKADTMTAAIGAAGVAEAVPFTTVPIPFPSAVDGGTPGALFGSPDYGLAVNAKSKVRNAATTFALWLSSATAGQQIVADSLADVPSLNGVSPQLSGLVDESVQLPALQDLITQAGTVTEDRLLSNADLATAIGVAGTTVAAGDATPAEAAKTLQAAAEKAGVTF
ncbi:ABC transporter substrate-binding protein [Amnibacterium flavum]|uniref:Carbohydrate ABC transporter substrate-binding protein n=1 Tax=Amnibacterium flavum TaxID=2173173 RepID=A0A2V1HWK8_9MICO|nr:ABC transporter substrate-binding protein [Amnibacterium flavum]PVZ94594.1 carbohydrate ABC transporter substrate-binding protein [Amnibacterium flavum]